MLKYFPGPWHHAKWPQKLFFFPWKWKSALWSYLLLMLTTGSTPDASPEHFLSWVTSHPDRSHPVITLTQKSKPTNGHPEHSKDKPSLGKMQKKVTIPADRWTTPCLRAPCDEPCELWPFREIDTITRHNQNDNIMKHLQLIFTFWFLKRLFCYNSLVYKRNLARQLLWFSLQSGCVKKVRKLL